MKEEYKKYLPIGTVIMLKKGKKRLMITGYAQIDMEKVNTIYDYCGCIFPEGMISTKQNYLFNHEDIEKIYAIGYQDEEQKKFTEELQKVLTPENIKKMLQAAKESNQKIESLEE